MSSTWHVSLDEKKWSPFLFAARSEAIRTQHIVYYKTAYDPKLRMGGGGRGVEYSCHGSASSSSSTGSHIKHHSGASHCSWRLTLHAYALVCSARYCLRRRRVVQLFKWICRFRMGVCMCVSMCECVYVQECARVDPLVREFKCRHKKECISAR